MSRGAGALSGAWIIALATVAILAAALLSFAVCRLVIRMIAEACVAAVT